MDNYKITPLKGAMSITINCVVITDNLQNIRFYQRSSKTMNDNTMFRTKINLLTRKTVLKVSLFQTLYWRRLLWSLEIPISFKFILEIHIIRKIFPKYIGLDWNALFRVDKMVEKSNQINEWIIQVLAHINRYV